MHYRLVFICLCTRQPGLAQEFKVWDRTVQVHGCFSQGSVRTDQNNWLNIIRVQISDSTTFRTSKTLGITQL